MRSPSREAPVLEVTLELCQGAFSLRVEARLGEAAAILGPSGAGKTSLLEAVAGLRRAAGRVVLGGEVLQDTAAGRFLPPERRRLGYVPQDGALFPHLSVRRNMLFAVPRRFRSRTDLEEVAEVLDLVPLLDRFPRHLSGGERRRVALGRALLADPRLLLLDEPAAGLDPERARRVLAYVQRARDKRGVPLLLVTHRQEEALALAREVMVLEAGRVVASGAVRDVLMRPEVLGTRGEARSENVVRGRTVAHDVEGGVTQVGLEGGGEVTIPHHPDLAAGALVMLAVDAEEVLVATSSPVGLSARNAFAGRVDALLPVGGSVYVRVGEWLARLTPAAVRELDLASGQPVWLVVKTHSWRVILG